MSEHTLLNTIRRTFKKVATTLFTRDVATFLFFLVLAFLFWVMHSTSATRNLKSKVKIEYVGIPNNIQLLDSLPDHTSMTFKDRGAALWSFYFEKLPPLVIDLSKQFSTEGTMEYDMNESLLRYMTHFPASTQLYDNEVMQISIRYNVLERKIVPVRFKTPFEPQQPYVLKDSIKLTPANVEIYAPKNAIDTINEVYLTEISNNYTKSITLQVPIQKTPYTQTSIELIEVDLPIEISTEKRLDLPITAIGFPSHTTLRTFPAEASVVFTIGISKFQEINESDFQLVIFRDSLEQQHSQKAKLYLKEQPEGIHQLKITPSEVDYIIEIESNK